MAIEAHPPQEPVAADDLMPQRGRDVQHDQRHEPLGGHGVHHAHPRAFKGGGQGLAGTAEDDGREIGAEAQCSTTSAGW